MLNNLHKARLNQRLNVCRRWSYSPLIYFCLNQALKTCRSLTSTMTCRSAISCTPALHKMMTVPVASRPLLPALPAIWMYSPVRNIKETSISCCAARLWFTIKENNQREDQNLAADFWNRCRRVFWCCQTRRSWQACSPPLRTSLWQTAPEREGRHGFTVFKCHSGWCLN